MELTPAEAAEMLDGSDVELVDVREDAEHAAGRIAGDRHIPLQRLPAEAEALDPAKPLIFYCHSGARSLMAAQAFDQAGFQAYSLAGGLVAWEAAGLPVDGEVAHH